MPDTIPPPTQTPPPAEPAPAEPVKPPSDPHLLSTILGLIDPGAAADVKPVDPNAEPVTPEKPVDPKPDPKPEPKPDESEPVEAKVSPPVRRRAPADDRPPPTPAPSADEVRRIVAEENAKLKPPDPPKAPDPDDSDLTVEEREELELAAYAEKKDPTKKGLTETFRKFYAEQKAFLDKRTEEEGDDYDPAQDPKYKNFLRQKEPKFSQSERKKIFADKLTESVREQTVRETEERFNPTIKKLEAKTRELEHAPQITNRIAGYTKDLADSMPKEIVEFFEKSGRDVAKTEAEFPGEFEVVASTVRGASSLAEEALQIRRGLKAFDLTNPRHEFLDKFVAEQADHLLAHRDARFRERDGKTFIHPHQYHPSMAAKHWTFDEEDLLGLIKMRAVKEANERITAKRNEVKASAAASARRAAAPNGTTPPAAVETPPTVPSTRTAPVPSPGAATSTPGKGSKLSELLNL